MQSRIARLRFIFDYGRGESFYGSLPDMGTLERPNNPTRVTGNQASGGAHNMIEQAADAARPLVDSTASAHTAR
jgi:hypothetical protein